MAEVSNELIYKLMLDIQAEQRQMRAEQDVISQKIGTTAETLVGIKREISVNKKSPQQAAGYWWKQIRIGLIGGLHEVFW